MIYIKELENDSGEFGFEVEKNSNLTILRKSNDLKGAAIEKESDLVELKNKEGKINEIKGTVVCGESKCFIPMTMLHVT